MKTPKKRQSTGSAEKGRRKRGDMQAPFRPRDLLSTDRFISFCADRGIQTDRQQLEFYDKHDLLIPAVRVHRGHVRFRRILIPQEGGRDWRLVFADDLKKFSPLKIDPKTYFDFDAVSQGSRDWLAQYEEREQVSYPAKERYRPWQEDLLVRRKSLPTTLKDLGEGVMDFYARNQCFALKEVQARMVVEVRDAALFMDDEDWLATGRRLRRGIVDSLPLVQDAILGEYRLAALLDQIHDVMGEMHVEARATFAASIEDGESRADAKRDARAANRLFEKQTAPGRLRKLIKDRKYSIEDIRRERQRVAHRASELDPTYRWTDFTGRIPPQLLQQARGDYALALEYYRIANELGWLLRRLGDKPPTLKKLLTGADRLGHCIVCGEPFERLKSNRVTCGRPECIRGNKNDLKRLGRRLP